MTQENAAAAGPSLVGHSIDERYQLEAQIGLGGLGTVYRATHTKLQRAVAVKLLHESYGASAVQRARFEREAKALAMLEHSNIVSVMDYGVADDRPYLVMELLEGETLSQCLKRGPLPIARAVSIAQQMLNALAFMHSEGLLHRDIKPSNVFLQRTQRGNERVKVLDFGLAKFTAPTPANADPTLTRDGSVVGTPAYMSPEQATGEAVDARSDVYAVGIILFQMLSGRLPFVGDAIEQIRSHLVDPVPALGRVGSDAEIDAALDGVIQRATAKRRDDRFADGGEMLAALLVIFPHLVEAAREFDSVSTVLRAAQPDFAGEASEPLAVLLDSSEPVTRARGPAPTWWERGFARLRGAVRALLVAGVRVIATVSVVLVLASVAVVVLLFRNEADKADLVAWRHRVSERLMERSFHGAGAAQTVREPIRALGSGGGLQLLAAGRGVAASAAPGRVEGAAGQKGSALAAAPPMFAGSAAAAHAAASGEGNSNVGVDAGTNTSTSTSTGAGADARPLVAVGERVASPAILGPPAARNPWAGPIPRELRVAHTQAMNGSRGTQRLELALTVYNQAHPEDPRGHLLLAQLYFNRLWRPDSVAQFAAALQVDLSARGAPEVLSALVVFVVQGKVARDAERLIVKAFGSEALPAIEHALETAKEPKASARLRTLRARLAKA